MPFKPGRDRNRYQPAKHPEHKRDPRIRLRVIARDYTPIRLDPRDTCDCKRGAKCERAVRKAKGYKRRHAVWQTTDGRFTMRWMTHKTATGWLKSHPRGALRMYDEATGRTSYHYNLREACVEIARRYDRSELEAAERAVVEARARVDALRAAEAANRGKR